MSDDEEALALARKDDEQLAAWVRDTCFMFGTTVATAYQVAGLFMKALYDDTR